MRKPIAETARPSAPRPLPGPRVPRGWRLRVPRLGIGRRLGLGLAAVTTVLMLGEGLPARTTREALEGVRSMQNEDEPLANSANAVLEGLLAYDRAVDEDLQAHNPDQLRAMTGAGDALEAAVAYYFGSSPPPPVTASGAALRLQLTRHIAGARQLASRAAQRAQWVAERQAALNQVFRSEEHTSELQSRLHLVCRLLLEKKKNNYEHVRESEPPGLKGSIGGGKEKWIAAEDI